MYTSKFLRDGNFKFVDDRCQILDFSDLTSMDHLSHLVVQVYFNCSIVDDKLTVKTLYIYDIDN